MPATDGTPQVKVEESLRYVSSPVPAQAHAQAHMSGGVHEQQKMSGVDEGGGGSASQDDVQQQACRMLTPSNGFVSREQSAVQDAEVLPRAAPPVLASEAHPRALRAIAPRPPQVDEKADEEVSRHSHPQLPLSFRMAGARPYEGQLRADDRRFDGSWGMMTVGDGQTRIMQMQQEQVQAQMEMHYMQPYAPQYGQMGMHGLGLNYHTNEAANAGHQMMQQYQMQHEQLQAQMEMQYHGMPFPRPSEGLMRYLAEQQVHAYQAQAEQQAQWLPAQQQLATRAYSAYPVNYGRIPEVPEIHRQGLAALAHLEENAQLEKAAGRHEYAIPPPTIPMHQFCEDITIHYRDNMSALASWEALCMHFNRRSITVNQFYAGVYKILYRSGSMHLLEPFKALMPGGWGGWDMERFHREIEVEVDRMDNANNIMRDRHAKRPMQEDVEDGRAVKAQKTLAGGAENKHKEEDVVDGRARKALKSVKTPVQAADAMVLQAPKLRQRQRLPAKSQKGGDSLIVKLMVNFDKKPMTAREARFKKRASQQGIWEEHVPSVRSTSEETQPYPCESEKTQPVPSQSEETPMPKKKKKKVPINGFRAGDPVETPPSKTAVEPNRDESPSAAKPAPEKKATTVPQRRKYVVAGADEEVDVSEKTRAASLGLKGKKKV
ncbi:hypothetical protein LTR08_006364 [Meristemomyces frigidus]|nr:hypothetical protein LTR08_006364 [Meristemomyces frigidus]